PATDERGRPLTYWGGLAQPERGEVTRFSAWEIEQGGRGGTYVSASDYDRLQSSLTAAQQQIALHKADAANAIARTDEIGRRLIEAQQREAELRAALRQAARSREAHSA